MSDGEVECQCVVDTAALHAIASMSGNLKAIYTSRLSKGIIGVATSAWKEFEDAYEDEAAELAPFIAKKITLKKAYTVGAASIADNCNAKFSHGPYDTQADLYSASICWVEKWRLLTISSQVPYYKNMNCCEVSDVEEWVTSVSE